MSVLGKVMSRQQLSGEENKMQSDLMHEKKENCFGGENSEAKFLLSHKCSQTSNVYSTIYSNLSIFDLPPHNKIIYPN